MAKSTSKSAEAQANRYKTEKRWEFNRLKRLERALKLYPGNAKQLEAAMACLVYRRKTPKTQVWSSTKRRTAQLFKLFSGKVNNEIFNSNEKVSVPALMLAGKVKAVKGKYTSDSKMFTLGARAHDTNGNLVWS